MDRHIPFGEKLATLVVGGVEKEISGGIYGDDAVLVLTDAFQEPPADFSGRGREPYRAALVVENGKISENKTVWPALQGGSVTDSCMDGVEVHSTTANFNHAIIVNSDYTIRDCKFKADTDSDGKKVCDFNGYGSLVCGFKGSRLTLENCQLFSRGVAKPVVFVDGGSNCLMKNSTYKCMGGTLYAGYQNTAGFFKMVAPPWVLGIPGTARGTNLMGTCSTFTFVDSDCQANDWGVISTDGGKELALYVIDTRITLLGEGYMLDNPYVRRFGPGYGVYAAGCDEFFHGAEFNVGTYAIISTGGNIVLASSRGEIKPRQKYLVPTGRYEIKPDGHREEIKDVFWKEEPVFAPIAGKGKPTVVNSDGWGFMFHGNSSISLLDGTICNTDYATFLIRAVSVDITVDSSTLTPGDGTILQMIDNDDKAVGGQFTPDIYDDEGNLIQPHMGPIFNHEFFEHPGFPGLDYETECRSSGGEVTAKFTNCSLAGSFYNATGYRGIGDGPRGQGEELYLTLGQGAALDGTITSAASRHIDEKGRPNNTFTMEQYYYLGHVENRPHFNGVNGVHVTLEDNALWTVQGENILASLTVGKDAAIITAPGTSLCFTVDGVEIPLEPGQKYTGEICLKSK